MRTDVKHKGELIMLFLEILSQITGPIRREEKPALEAPPFPG